MRCFSEAETSVLEGKNMLFVTALNSLGKELKSQQIDFEEISYANRASLTALRDLDKAMKSENQIGSEMGNFVDDKGLQEIIVSFRAYNARLNAIQGECKILEAAVTDLLHAVTSGESPANEDVKEKSATDVNNTSDADAFVNRVGVREQVEDQAVKTGSPNNSQKEERASSINATEKATNDCSEPVEHIEFIKEDFTTPRSAKESQEGSEEDATISEIEVETVESEFADPAPGVSVTPEGSVLGADLEALAETFTASKTTKEIIATLFENSVDFSHCRSEKELRFAFKEYYIGQARLLEEKKKSRMSANTTENFEACKNKEEVKQPPVPPRSATMNTSSAMEAKQNGAGNASTPFPGMFTQAVAEAAQMSSRGGPDFNSGSEANSGGLTADPFPSALRMLCDPTKTIRQIKTELAQEKGFFQRNPSMPREEILKKFDLFCNGQKLSEWKQMIEYPMLAQYPIHVKMYSPL